MALFLFWVNLDITAGELCVFLQSFCMEKDSEETEQVKVGLGWKLALRVIPNLAWNSYQLHLPLMI